MRILLLRPDALEGASEGSSVRAVLEELGCRVSVARLDLGDLEEEELVRAPPTIVVVNASEALETAAPCRRALGRIGALDDVPTLLLVPADRVSSLDVSIGFDDFILTPIVPTELYARLRQLDWRSAAFRSEEVIKIGELVIDVAGYEARVGGRSLEFTHQEFELLRFLAQNRGRVYSRDQLLSRVWGYQYSGGTRTVDIHVRRVRAKLGQSADLIVTVRNVGYKMRGTTPDD